MQGITRVPLRLLNPCDLSSIFGKQQSGVGAWPLASHLDHSYTCQWTRHAPSPYVVQPSHVAGRLSFEANRPVYSPRQGTTFPSTIVLLTLNIPPTP